MEVERLIGEILIRVVINLSQMMYIKKNTLAKEIIEPIDDTKFHDKKASG